MTSPTTAPRARPAATGVSLLLALGLVALAVVGVHDLAVDRGWSQGSSWVTAVVDALDGRTADGAVLAVSIGAAVVGLLLLVVAVAPARRTHLRVRADADVWVSPAAVGSVARAAADRAPGVVSAQTDRATRRKVVLEVVTQRDASQVEDDVRTAVGSSLAGLTPVKVAVRTAELPR